MQFEKRDSPVGTVAIVTMLTKRIEDTGDFLDVLASGASDTLVLKEEHLNPAFFDLKTGIAGDMLQKVSTYSKRPLIVGDFEAVGSEALRDFIRESNRTGRVVFSNSLETGIAALR
jgi:hypothetical protein